jgi:hypothetical protein
VTPLVAADSVLEQASREATFSLRKARDSALFPKSSNAHLRFRASSFKFIDVWLQIN